MKLQDYVKTSPSNGGSCNLSLPKRNIRCIITKDFKRNSRESNRNADEYSTLRIFENNTISKTVYKTIQKRTATEMIPKITAAETTPKRTAAGCDTEVT